MEEGKRNARGATELVASGRAWKKRRKKEYQVKRKTSSSAGCPSISRMKVAGEGTFRLPERFVPLLSPLPPSFFRLSLCPLPPPLFPEDSLTIKEGRNSLLDRRGFDGSSFTSFSTSLPPPSSLSLFL